MKGKEKSKELRIHSFFAFLIVVSTLFLGIGYASVSGVTLNLVGTANVVKYRAVIITNVEYVSNNDADLTNSYINDYWGSSLNSSIALGNSLNSTITYRVTVLNNTSNTSLFEDAIYSEQFYDNEDITFELSGINIGDSIAPGASKSFNITFKYDSNLESITDNTLNSYINFKFLTKNPDFVEAGPVIFDGTNYINTGVRLFDSTNVSKDFEVRFTIDSMDGNQTNHAVLFSDMNESGSPWPGVVFRYSSNTLKLIVNSTTTGDEKKITVSSYPAEIIIRRIDGIIYYKVGNGNFIKIENQSFAGFSNPFNVPATFGAGIDKNNEYFRFFKGSLSNISINLDSELKYNIYYNKNSSSAVGSMTNQVVPIDYQTTLKPNGFTNKGYRFLGWNSRADGSGISFTDEQSITNLVNASESITMYAQWEKASEYYVVYDKNNSSATGSMANQTVYIDHDFNLSPIGFSLEHANFAGWNTSADGTGTSYTDEQSVGNIGNSGETVTLYAQWSNRRKYQVIFHANGGTGTMPNEQMYEDESKTLSKNLFTKTDSEFVGWNTSANGTGIILLRMLPSVP